MSDSNALVQWDPNSGAALPAYLAEAAEEFGSNIPDRQTVPSLSYEGKNWTIVINGNRTKMQKRNDDGDLEPVSIMRMIILGFNNDRGRAYYTGSYNPAAASAPKCWSANGVEPDPSVREKESAVCANCPQSIKGSRVVDGREMVACAQHRLLGIAPAFDILSEPLRLKIAVTSDYDKELVEHGYFAFRQYVDYLKSRGVPNTALVVTKVKFDPNTAFPKLLFALDRALTPQEIAQVREAKANPKLATLLTERWTPAGVNGTPSDDSDIAPAATQAPAPAVPAARQIVDVEPKPAVQKSPLDAAREDGWVVHPDNPAYHYRGDEVVDNDALVARYGAPSTPKAPPAPAVEPEPEYDPLDAARADGWVLHPENPAYHYRGDEVVDNDALQLRYPRGNGAAGATAPSSAPDATQASGSQTSGNGQTATMDASPSSGDELPPEVKAMLDKWTGD